MADKTELRMNLAAIKRVDPYAKDIIDSSAHVAFYTFNPDETEWEKTDVEGAFFVYSRNAEPYHSIFINNRLNTNSLVEPITAHIELQSQPPFLLYRNERSRIRGFWFYDRSECDRIGELVERIVKDCDPAAAAATATAAAATATSAASSTGPNKGTNSSGSAPPPPASGSTAAITVAATPSTGTGIGSGPSKPIDMARYSSSNVDIFSMLSKAQQDFNNSLSTPGASAKNNAPAQLGPAQVLSMSNGSGNQCDKPTSHAAVPIAIPPKTVAADGTSQSVMNFFAAAKPATKPPTEPPFLQRMMSAPVRITCDQIEKQHRVTPHNEKQSSSSSPPPPPAPPLPQQQPAFTKSTRIENGFGFMRIHSPSQQPSVEFGASPLATFIGGTSNCLAGGGLANMRDGNKNVAGKESDAKEPLQELLKKPAPILAAALANSTNTTPHKPALMPPTMFKSTGGTATNKSTTNAANAKNTNVTNSGSGSGSGGGGDGGGGPATTVSNAAVTNNVHSIKKETITSIASANKSQKRNTVVQQQQQQQQSQQSSTIGCGAGTSSHKPSSITKPEPLTQSQLLQAMTYLIKNDPEFVRKIHDAYLKSFNEKDK